MAIIRKKYVKLEDFIRAVKFEKISEVYVIDNVYQKTFDGQKNIVLSLSLTAFSEQKNTHLSISFDLLSCKMEDGLGEDKIAEYNKKVAEILQRMQDDAPGVVLISGIIEAE